MDEFTRDLELMEVISAADAMVNARVDLEEAEADGRIDEERWEAIRRHVFPCLRRRRSAWTGSTGACDGDPSVGAFFKVLRVVGDLKALEAVMNLLRNSLLMRKTRNRRRTELIGKPA